MTKPTDNQIILEALMGSHAFGLATPESDKDYAGIFLEPNDKFLGLNPPNDKSMTYHSVGKEADYTYHELQKFCKLAAACNPSILELLWRDDYTIIMPSGDRLIAIRNYFLSTAGVRNAFGGYAMSQAEKFRRRGRDLPRYTKHARHCFRLLRQGRQLQETGTMTLWIEDPEEFFALGLMGPDALWEKFEAEFAMFDAIQSVLPAEPNKEIINSTILEIRSHKG
jgi:predicted nucleotidyltransferase